MAVQIMEMRPGARRGGIAVLGTAGSRRWVTGRASGMREQGVRAEGSAAPSLSTSASCFGQERPPSASESGRS